MVEYFRIGRRPSMAVRRLLQAAAALALFSFGTSLSASAQNAPGGNHSAQAVLHIRVNIVPTVMTPLPPTEPNRLLPTTVTYNVPTAKSNVEMIEETRSLPPASTKAIGSQGAVLQTVTIVVR